MRTVVVAALLAFASTAHAQYTVVYPDAIIDLNGAQRTELAAVVDAIWPPIAISGIYSFRCQRSQKQICDADTNECTPTTGAMCVAESQQSLSAAQIATADRQGLITKRPNPDDIAADGSSATVDLRWGPEFVYGANLTSLLNFLNTHWGTEDGQLFRFRFVRKGAPGNYTYNARRYRRVGVSPTELLLCLKAETCTEVVR